MRGVIHAMKAADVRGGTHRMQSELRIYIEVDSILIFKGTFHNSHYLVVLQRDYCGIMLKQHGPHLYCYKPHPTPTNTTRKTALRAFAYPLLKTQVITAA